MKVYDPFTNRIRRQCFVEVCETERSVVLPDSGLVHVHWFVERRQPIACRDTVGVVTPQRRGYMDLRYRDISCCQGVERVAEIFPLQAQVTGVEANADVVAKFGSPRYEVRDEGDCL